MSDSQRPLTFITPFLWQDRLQSRVVGHKTVAWMLTVPITEQERAIADK